MPKCVDFKSYRLYEQGAGPELRIVKLVTRAEGERMVRSKAALAGVDRDGETLCFRRMDAFAAGAVPAYRKTAKSSLICDADMPAEISSAAFSQPEMMAIAGTKFRHGRSRTARMTEEQRQARMQRIYEESVERSGRGVKVKPEDTVERATNKYKAWAQIPVLMDRVRVAASL